MEITREGNAVQLRMTVGEAERRARAVREGTDHSRAEYWIRTGIPRPQADALVDAIQAIVFRGVTQIATPLEQGIEEIENPRRSRSGHD